MPNISKKQLKRARKKLRPVLRRPPPRVKLQKPVVVYSKTPAAPSRAPPSRPREKGWLAKILGTAGGALGGAFFGPGGAMGGAALGKGAGDLFTHITGMGQYKVSKNSLTNGQAPQFGNGTGTIVFAHSEFLQDVKGSVAFTNQVIPINPGLFASFPFLSALTVNFEQYEFLGLVFTFKSTSANALNSTNTALGTVIMSTNYDALDTAFTNKQQMEAYMFTTSTKPSESMMHPVECAPRMSTLTNMYVRPGAVPTGSDARFYDLGNFQIATVGMQAAAVIGELWVSYHVRLLKPKLPTPVGAGLLGGHFSESPAFTAATATVFGTGTPVMRAGSNLDLKPTAAGTFSMPIAGTFLLAIVGTTTDTVGPPTTPVTITAGANISSNAILIDSSTAGVGAVLNIVGLPNNYNFSTLFVLNVNAAGTSTANNVSVFYPANFTLGAVDVIVQQISSGITMDTTDKRRGYAIDDLMERISALELSNRRRLGGSITDDDDWKCRETNTEKWDFNHQLPLRLAPVTTVSSSSSSSSSKLSDSVVNLITEKLRK